MLLIYFVIYINSFNFNLNNYIIMGNFHLPIKGTKLINSLNQIYGDQIAIENLE